MAWIHNADDYILSINPVFGSEVMILPVSGKNQTYPKSIYALNMELRNRMPDGSCVAQGSSGFESCLNRYLANEIGCSPPWFDKELRNSMRTCRTATDLKMILKIMDNVSYF